MKTRTLFLVMALAGCLCAGCVSMDPEKFSQEIKQWVPLGTPSAEAKRIMEHHGFECDIVKQDNMFNPFGSDCLECYRNQVWFHDWSARFILTNDKVSGYESSDVE